MQRLGATGVTAGVIDYCARKGGRPVWSAAVPSVNMRLGSVSTWIKRHALAEAQLGHAVVMTAVWP